MTSKHLDSYWRRNFFQVLMYAADSETWNMGKTDSDGVQSFHMRSQHCILVWNDMVRSPVPQSRRQQSCQVYLLLSLFGATLVFGHICDYRGTPISQALLLSIEAFSGPCPTADWKKTTVYPSVPKFDHSASAIQTQQWVSSCCSALELLTLMHHINSHFIYLLSIFVTLEGSIDVCWMPLTDAVRLLCALNKLHWVRCLSARLVARNTGCPAVIVRTCPSAIFSHILHIVISALVVSRRRRESFRQRCFQQRLLLGQLTLEPC